MTEEAKNTNLAEDLKEEEKEKETKTETETELPQTEEAAKEPQKKKRKKKKKAKPTTEQQQTANANLSDYVNPKPSRQQTKPEPTIPIAALYTNGKFPRGETMEYSKDCNVWRTTNEEKRLMQKMTDIDIEPFRHGAEVHRQVRQWAHEWIKPGMTYLEIGDKIENKVRELIKAQGLERGMAFPCGLSMNNIAAHWAPNLNDKTVLKASDVVKVDFGTHVNGNIVDSAWTFCFDPQFQPLLDCVKDATNTGLRELGIDVQLCDVGAAIQEVMESYEVTINGKTYPIKSVHNLSGHTVGPYTIHAGKTVPLVRGGPTTRIEEGDVVAIETFGSTGKGSVHDDGECSHYMVDPDANISQVRNPKARELLHFLKTNYSTLAFARRWLEGKAPKGYQLYLKQLVDCKAVNPYPPLCDVGGSYVAQFEHTIYMKPSSKEVLSRGTDY